MNVVNLVTDEYDRKARLYPAFLLVAPVVLTVVAIISPEVSLPGSLGTALVGFGGAFLLVQLARDAGKKGEKELFKRWGGMPSAAIFRHRDARLQAITKARYHKRLSVWIKEAKAPSLELEQAEPDTADAIYAAWSDYLRLHTRDPRKFALLFQENINYGYRRNIWGLRPWGIVTSLLSCSACGFRLYAIYVSTGKLDKLLAGAEILLVFLFLFWVFRFTSDWVRVAADAYADRLVECTETLGPRSTTTRNTGKK